MGVGFAEAVARTHGALDARDEPALADVLANLGDGMEPNQLTAPEIHNGERPLNVAAAAGFSRGVALLLEAGAGANVPSDSNEDRGLLPLSFAVRCGDTAATIATCQALCDAGADTERGHLLGTVPPPLAQVVSAPEPDTELALALLRMGCSVASWPMFLHWQCARDDITAEILSEAAKVGKGKIPAADNRRITALHTLCQNPRVDEPLLLALNSGSTAAVKSKTGTLPVTLLCRNPSITSAALDAVLAGLPRGISVKDGTGSAGIHDLAKNPALDEEMVKTALHYDPKCCTVRDPEGRTALHLVALRPGGATVPVLQLLLKAHPAGVSEVDVDQRTPLHCQLLSAEADLAPSLSLVAASESVMGMQESEGRNPLQCCLDGQCGPRSALERRHCWSLLEALVRLYPKGGDASVARTLCSSPHLTRSLLSALLQRLPASLVQEKAPDGSLLIHTVLNRPPASTLGTREPLGDGHLVDAALMLIDRYKGGCAEKAGPLEQTPMHMLTSTWRASARRGGDEDDAEALPESRPGSPSATGYNSSMRSYSEFHGYKEMSALHSSAAKVRGSAAGNEDLDIGGIVTKICDQVAGLFGEACWNAKDGQGRTPIEYARTQQLWTVEGALRKTGGPALDRTLQEMVVAPDVADAFPDPPASTLRMKAWKDNVKSRQTTRTRMPHVEKSDADLTFNELDAFETRLRRGDPARGRAPTPGVDGKEDGFEYDSEEDFVEPGGFDMDMSTDAAGEYMDGRPRSRLEATLLSDPRAATPAPGEANVLALLCANVQITTEALEMMLDANSALASRAHGPEDTDAQPWWPCPLHLLCCNPMISSIETSTLQRLVDAHPPALALCAAAMVDVDAPGAEELVASPLHLLCFSPACSASHLSLILASLVDYETSLGVGPEESVANRVAQALAGSQGAGTAMELLCANPSGLPAVGTFLRFFPQAAHPVPPNSWEGVGLLDGEFCGATALHRAASNPSITEDLLETIADAAPEAVLLTDELGRLPIHLLAANPGPSCDIWTLKRLMERTPPPCFKLVSEAPNAPTILHALCGRREKDDADTAEAVQMLLDACQCQTAAWPGLYYHSPPASATFHLEDGTAVAKPTWLKKHVDWPQTWTLHRGGALQLARQHGLAATVEVLEGAGFVVDESATDDFAAFWPRRDRTKLFLDAKATKPAPDGTIPFRWDDDDWQNARGELLAGSDAALWTPWARPGPTARELAAQAAAEEAERLAAEEEAAARRAEEEAAAAAAAAGEEGSAQAEEEGKKGKKGKKKKR